MEKYNLDDHPSQLVNQYLQENGRKVFCGTIVYARIMSAPSSAKNKKKERDPEKHQTLKGNLWYSGISTHIDSQAKLIHPVVATPKQCPGLSDLALSAARRRITGVGRLCIHWSKVSVHSTPFFR